MENYHLFHNGRDWFCDDTNLDTQIQCCTGCTVFHLCPFRNYNNNKFKQICRRKSTKNKKILVFIGDNTMMILTWHFLSFKIVSIVLIYCYGLSVKKWHVFP